MGFEGAGLTTELLHWLAMIALSLFLPFEWTIFQVYGRGRVVHF